MTKEAYARDLVKNKLLTSSEEDTTVSRAFTGKPLRVIKNAYTEKYRNDPSLLLPGPMQITQAMKDGCWAHYFGIGKTPDSAIENVDVLAFSVGQCIGGITKIEPAGDIVRQVVVDAIRCLRDPTNYQLSKL